MKEAIFTGNFAKNHFKQLLTVLVFCLPLQNIYASSLLPCGVSLDHTDIVCPLEQTGSITVNLSTDEAGTFQLEWLQAPTPISPESFTVTPADIDPGTGLFQDDIVTYNGLSEGTYDLMITTPAGNICVAQATIFAADGEPPTVACPPDITVPAEADCQALVFWDLPNMTDGCSVNTISSTHQPGDIFQIGTTLVTYTVTDQSGNIAECSFVVTVEEGACITPCEIIASASSPICSDNGTPNDPSDDTYTFEVTVINGTGTTFNDDMGNQGLPYGLAVSYGSFPVSGGDVTITFTDVEDAECATTVGVTPPAPCSDDIPTPPEIQPIPNIIPNDNCGMTNNVYGDVLSDTIPLHFRLFSCLDDTPSNPNVYPEFDANGEPHIPGMIPQPNHIEKFEDIPSTTFCIENVMPGRYYLLVWNDLLQYDIECFIVPPILEVVGPAIIPQDKTGKKHNAYLFAQGGVKPYRYKFYQCPEGTPDDFQPGTNPNGSPDLSDMTEITQEHLESNGFLCIQDLDEGQHYVLIEDSAGRWKWICYETPKELQATLEDFIPAWEGDTRVYVDVCGGEPDYTFNLFTCPEPAPDELPTPEYAADGTLVVEGMTEVSGFAYTQVTPERICIDLPPGTYYLLVRDSGGRCTWVCIDIPVVEPLDAELLEVIPFDDEHVRVYVRVTGGVPPYDFQPYTCPVPGLPLPDPTFPDGQPNVSGMEPFHDYDWVWNGPDTVCFTFPNDLENIYILFWGQAFCWDWVCIDFDVEPPPPCPDGYCIPYNMASSSDWIKQVTFCDIDNVSGNDGGYGDYTGMIAEVIVGQTQDILLTPQFNFLAVGVRWHVWIDFNQDCTFDSSERVVSYQGAATSISTPITIPIDATPGQTRMRVKMVTGRSLGANPCGDFERGEVEDYMVNISSGNGLIVPAPDLGGRNLVEMDLAMKVFPNPVRGQANIEFELPDDSFVTLFIADANGRHLTMLLDSELMLKGKHQANFDGSDLAAGVYYCTLKTSKAIKVEQINLVK